MRPRVNERENFQGGIKCGFLGCAAVSFLCLYRGEGETGRQGVTLAIGYPVHRLQSSLNVPRSPLVKGIRAQVNPSLWQA